MSALPKVFCAIDLSDLGQAKDISAAVVSAGCGLKLGLEFFNRFGPDGVRDIAEHCPGAPIFLDLKYYDIPNTVAGAVRNAADLGVTYINVHASGGSDMMKAAVDAADGKVKILGVTVLTSMNALSLQETGVTDTAEDQVVRLACLTQECGLDGVVCSAKEIEVLRAACGPDFVLMVPGIRPAGTDKGDQKRVMTPEDAMTAGATHLVIGRPITQADDPATAATDILNTI